MAEDLDEKEDVLPYKVEDPDDENDSTITGSEAVPKNFLDDLKENTEQIKEKTKLSLKVIDHLQARNTDSENNEPHQQSQRMINKNIVPTARALEGCAIILMQNRVSCRKTVQLIRKLLSYKPISNDSDLWKTIQKISQKMMNYVLDMCQASAKFFTFIGEIHNSINYFIETRKSNQRTSIDTSLQLLIQNGDELQRFSDKFNEKFSGFKGLFDNFFNKIMERLPGVESIKSLQRSIQKKGQFEEDTKRILKQQKEELVELKIKMVAKEIKKQEIKLAMDYAANEFEDLDKKIKETLNKAKEYKKKALKAWDYKTTLICYNLK